MNSHVSPMDFIILDKKSENLEIIIVSLWEKLLEIYFLQKIAYLHK